VNDCQHRSIRIFEAEMKTAGEGLPMLLPILLMLAAWTTVSIGQTADSPAKPEQETVQAKAVHDTPGGQRFRSAPVPAFAPGDVRLTLLASRSAALKPKSLVSDLLEPQDLVYDANGVLYVVASRAPPNNPDAGLNSDLIFVITPDGKARVFAESGIQGYPLTDHGRVPSYNGFTDLGQGPEGRLTALRNEVYPISVARDGVVSLVPFKIPGGTAIATFSDWDSSPATKKWNVTDFGYEQGRFFMYMEAPNPTWYTWVPGGVLEEIKNLDELPPTVTLATKKISGQLGPDGYSYYIDKVSDPKHPTLVRLGDPGQSILNPNATRTVIMELKITNPRDLLAFGPNRQIAISSEDGVYVVEAIP
jgi:hypothetical protein